VISKEPSVYEVLKLSPIEKVLLNECSVGPFFRALNGEFIWVLLKSLFSMDNLSIIWVTPFIIFVLGDLTFTKLNCLLISGSEVVKKLRIGSLKSYIGLMKSGK